MTIRSGSCDRSHWFSVENSHLCKDAAETVPMTDATVVDTPTIAKAALPSALPRDKFRSYIPQLRYAWIRSMFHPRQNASVTDHSKRRRLPMIYALILANDDTQPTLIPLTFRPPVFISEIVGRDLRRNRESGPRDTRATAGTKHPEEPLCLAWAKSGERRAGSQF
jgi:hypothetical protein